MDGKPPHLNGFASRLGGTPDRRPGGATDLFRNPNCRRLMDLIQEVPGLNIQELSDQAGIHRTAANYHVRRLIQAGYVATLRQGPHLLHFPVGIPPAQRVALGLLRIPSVRAAVQECFYHPTASWPDLAGRLHVTIRTVRRAIHALQRKDLVHLERHGRAREYTIHLHPDLRLVMARWIMPAPPARDDGPTPPDGPGVPGAPPLDATGNGT